MSQDTAVDFWRMVYEQNVSTIIMMDDKQLFEESCALYWPTALNNKRMDMTNMMGDGDGQLMTV